MIGIALGKQHGVSVVVVVVSYIDMQLLSVCIYEVPGIISGAYGISDALQRNLNTLVYESQAAFSSPVCGAKVRVISAVDFLS